MPDSLNARMAAALAPVLGEAAVYEHVWRCAEGHSMGPTTGWAPPGTSYCTEVVSARGERARVCAGTASYVAREPVDFANPAVGWGLWERWAHPRGHAFEAAPDLAPDRWIVGIPDLQEDLGFTATGSGVLEALLGAWSAALGLEGSGDA